ncbi:MAG: hypothetical protein KC619_20670 [Myxococcales bacterium]|nr:hypothetical protein [Myxococcales bacterium]
MRNATWTLFAGLLMLGCGASPAEPATPRAAPEAEAAEASLIGEWRFDLEASLARCERISAHDCAGWADLTDEAREARRAEYREGFARAVGGGMIFEPGVLRLDRWLGDSSEHSYTAVEAPSGWVVEIGEERMHFLEEGPGVVCIGERSESSDVLCLRRR